LAQSSSEPLQGLGPVPNVEAVRSFALRGELVAKLDRALLWGMGLGTCLMLQPFWGGGLRWGFFVTLGSTVLEIVTAHLLPDAHDA
jgi:hypothetical protein